MAPYPVPHPPKGDRSALAAALPLAALAISLTLLGGVAAPAAWAQPMGGATVVSADTGHAGEISVPVNKSRILRVDRAFKDIIVGNPEIADIMPLSDRSIYLLGKEVGSTNVTIYGNNKRLLAVVDVTVGHDAEGLKARLHEMLPGEPIEVRAVNGELVLSGNVTSARAAERAAAIAESYAPKAVTNLMGVTGSQQVLLEVRIVEMRRQLARQLGITGINAGKIGGSSITDVNVPVSGATIPSLLTGVVNPSTFLGLGLGVFDSTFFLDAALEALEEKGVLRTLAEPNLIALSGDTADFLAGGEFPIPVAQDNDTITVEWKPFGVGLAFTPTVLDDSLINLVVAPEVSEIDQANAFRVGNIVLPSFSTRRARTTVELRDGESFAIAGLLQSNFSDRVDQMPGLGDLPVIGALLRSTEFRELQTELVIMITPHLVKPVSPQQIAMPGEDFTPPTQGELFLLGKVEGEPAAPTRTGVVQELGSRPGGGISGPYGHILK